MAARLSRRVGGFPRPWCLPLPCRRDDSGWSAGRECLQASDRGGYFPGPWPAFGQAEPQTSPAAGEAGGDGEQAQPEAFRFPAAGGPGEGEHLRPGDQLAGEGDDLTPGLVPKTVKNRVHIDLATTSAAHQAGQVARLQELGAAPADVGQGDVPWTVLADPEGNEFCVLEPRSIYRDTGPIAAVVADCSEPRAMARFWGQAMDWTLHEVTDEHAVLRSAKGAGPYLEFLRTPGVKTVKNRVHLDLRPYPGNDQAAEVARLRALGATDIDVGQGDDVPWTCLADPEGNEFDVLTPR